MKPADPLATVLDNVRARYTLEGADLATRPAELGGPQLSLLRAPPPIWTHDDSRSGRRLRLAVGDLRLLVLSADFDEGLNVHACDYRRACAADPWKLDTGRSVSRAGYRLYLRSVNIPIPTDDDLRWLDIGGAP